MIDTDDVGAEAAYRAESARLIVQRLPVAVGLYLLSGAGLLFLEAVLHPDRIRLISIRYTLDACLCLLAVLCARRWPTGVMPSVAGAALVGAIGFLSAVYNILVGGSAERFVMIHVCILTAAAVLFPWGWRPQLGAFLAVVVSFALAAPALAGADALAFSALGLVMAGAISVVGASFLDHYRRRAFVGAAREREEGEIAATLLHVGRVLGTSLDRPQMLDGVNRLAMDALGCDSSRTFVWDPHRQAFRLAGAAGLRPDVLADLAQHEFSRDTLPFVAMLERGELVEITDPTDQRLIDPALMTRFDAAATLIAPITRGDHLVGTLACCHAEHTGPFSPRQRRLAVGIAQATAVALENARLIADLKQANQLKTEFVSTMSHELRTPLNVILGFSEMAQDASLPAAERERCMARVETAGRELMTLIEDTLEIGRMEHGRDDVRLEPVALPALWNELGTGCARMPRRTEVRLDWLDGVPPISVLTDARKITVVVRNLVSNALKFTERGHVRVEALIDGAVLVVRVSDTGIGIRSEDQKVIFEMFRQADSSDSRRYGGVGLGLHIVRRFVSQLNGSIELDSTPGVGSTFSVRLPVTRAPIEDAA